MLNKRCRFALNKFALALLLLLSGQGLAQCRYHWYLDADFSGAQSSSRAIQQGLMTALAEVDFKVKGCEIRLIEKDHQANPLTSRENLQAFLTDPYGLVVFSGLHSPPVLSNQSFINKNKILFLVPWAAAGPITRSSSNSNWIFRLSIDDSKAGKFITERALAEGFQRPFLLLEDTGWGRSNYVTMLQALKRHNKVPSGISWFKWGLSQNQAALLLNHIKRSEADVIFFVGNAPEGETFVLASNQGGAAFPIPIRSHWGITGGNFINTKTQSLIEKLDLHFIQTRFSFLALPLSEFAASVLKNAIDIHPELDTAEDIKAQTGFVHSYDLARILIAAMKQTQFTGNKQKDKIALHHALENLALPVQGLLKEYHRPFAPYSEFAGDAHEALSPKDYAMGRYRANGSVELIK